MSEAITTVKTQVIDGTFRDINAVKTEIKLLYEEGKNVELSYIIRIGRRLQEAKELVGHGDWGKWIEENLPFSQRKANLWMKAYEAYGANQESLFGEVNSQTFANLGISQAFALLEVPEEEREEFVKETHAEDLSVRELKKIIAEREAERDTAKEEQERLKRINESLRNSNKTLSDSLNEAKKSDEKLKETEDALKKTQMEKDAAEEAAKVAQKNLGTVMEKEKTLMAQFEEAKKAAETAQKKLEEAKKNPEISEELMRSLKEEAETKAKEAMTAETQIQLEKVRAEAQAQIEELQKKLKVSNSNVATFGGALNAMISAQNVVIGALKKVRNESEATAEGLLAALKKQTEEFLQKAEQ